MRTADVVPERSVVDYLLAATQGAGPPERLQAYVVRVPLPQGCTGELHLMPAGAAPSGDWPLSFSAMDDPGDRSVESMLAAVQQGADEYIGMLVHEWQRASFVTLHGGAPFRPVLSKRILDALARVHNVATKTRILWLLMRARTGFDDAPGRSTRT